MFVPAKIRVCVAHIALSIFCVYGGLGQTTESRIDSDGDGLSDRSEEALLEQFRPAFMISATDCAAKPARFKPGYANPEVAEADGTIYGQAFPVSGKLVEIHYYTLWSRDCGRLGHPLDAEHVSVLISNQDGAGWRALYWYAGAHEKTVCDISSGARSEAVAAEHHGPAVWSSSGKHALYFRSEMCNRGCGGDSCGDGVELPQNGPVINIGELNAPLNGSLWVASTKWMLFDKMDSDFAADVIARLDATSGDTVITVHGRSSVRGSIRGGDSAIDGAASGTQHTAAAMDATNTRTSSGLGKASRATGRCLTRAWKAIFRRKQPSS